MLPFLRCCSGRCGCGHDGCSAPRCRTPRGAAARLGAADSRACGACQLDVAAAATITARPVRASGVARERGCGTRLFLGSPRAWRWRPSSPQCPSSVSRSWRWHCSQGLMGRRRRGLRRHPRRCRAAASAALAAGSAGSLPAALAMLVPLLARLYGPRNVDPGARRSALRLGGPVPAHAARLFDHALGVRSRTCGCRGRLKDLLNGIIAVKAHNDTGHRSYLLGQVSLNRLVGLLSGDPGGQDPSAAARGRSARACVACAYGLARAQWLGARSGGSRAGLLTSPAPSAASTSASATCCRLSVSGFGGAYLLGGPGGSARRAASPTGARNGGAGGLLILLPGN